MENDDLAGAIQRRALELGYRKCGIVPVREMAGYGEKLAERIEEYPADRPLLERFGGFAEARKAFPWAEAVVVLVGSFGQYIIPAHLRGHIASVYLCDKIHEEGSRDNLRSRAFGEYLAGLGIRAETDRKSGLTSMRWAAMRAGLGIIRKNNFFYTEDGSSVTLSAWLIDKPLELKERATLKTCPDGCGKCVNACPTRALQRPYSLRSTACVAFMTGFGGNDLPAHPASGAMGGWIYGCDICQLACPFNNPKKEREEEEYPGLGDFGEKVSLTRIMDMSYAEIEELFAESFWYVSRERLWKWKVNTLNAMKNGYRDEYLPAIRKARNDSSEQVRAMAEWVLASLEPSAGHGNA